MIGPTTRLLATAICLLVVAGCGGEEQFTQEEVDLMIEEAVEEALAAQTTTTTSAPATTTTTPEDIADTLCSLATLEGECEGDATYVSLTLYSPNDVRTITSIMIDRYGFPSSIDARVGNTRALDGTLTAEGEGYEASWSYHPDDGLSMVIERMSS